MTSQHAKEAAARLYDTLSGFGHPSARANAMLLGISDNSPAVAAFAQFEAECLERAAVVAEGAASEKNAHPEYNMACWDIASTIRQLKDKV